MLLFVSTETVKQETSHTSPSVECSVPLVMVRYLQKYFTFFDGSG